MTPTFDEDITSYAVTTTNASNTITAVPVESTATVEIEYNGATYSSGDSLTWVSGTNTVDVNVTNKGVTKTYTIEVTK